jgi:hypothetical protein
LFAVRTIASIVSFLVLTFKYHSEATESAYMRKTRGSDGDGNDADGGDAASSGLSMREIREAIDASMNALVASTVKENN